MAQYFGSWLVALAAMYPVAIRVMESDGKPVDLVLSDFLYLLIVLTPPRKLLAIPEGVELKKLATIRVAAVVCIAYCLALSLTGYAGSGEASRLISAAKFVKPMSFVLLGTYLSMLFPPLLLLRRMGIVLSLIVLCTLGTALTNPHFPRCGWGNYLFAWETYGYPNAPMTFYGIMVPLIIAVGDTQRRRSLRLLYRFAAVIAMLLVVASLSRSSTISMTFAVTGYLIATGRGHIPIGVAVAGALLGAAGVGLLKVDSDIEAVQFLQTMLERRLSQTVEGEDPFSGRTAIWLLTLELIADKPVVGYAFEAFSRYSFFDTPHQQYLEVVYKTGLIGGVFYLWMLAGAIMGLCHLIHHAPKGSAAKFLLKALLFAFLGTLVGNLSQPNLTYSLTGNTLYLMLGLMLNRHGASWLVGAPAVLPAVPQPAATQTSLQPHPA
jgi:O-antigen ligase